MEKSVKLQRTAALIGAGICAALFIIAYALYGKELFQFVSDTERFSAWLQSCKGASAAVFVAIRTFQTVIKIIPAEPLEIAAGYAYGAVGGAALCLLGSVLGSVLILLLVKTFGQKMLNLFVPQKVLNRFSYLNDESRVAGLLFIIYLIPSTPKDIITYLSGFLKIKPWKFLLITSLARIPSIVTSTICGAELGKNNLFAAAVFIATLVVGAVGTALYEGFVRKRRKTDPQCPAKKTVA